MFLVFLASQFIAANMRKYTTLYIYFWEPHSRRGSRVFHLTEKSLDVMLNLFFVPEPSAWGASSENALAMFHLLPVREAKVNISDRRLIFVAAVAHSSNL